jgi:hypothetical protein
MTTMIKTKQNKLLNQQGIKGLMLRCGPVVQHYPSMHEALPGFILSTAKIPIQTNKIKGTTST